MLALVLFGGFLVGALIALVLIIRGPVSVRHPSRRSPGYVPRAVAFVLGGAAIGGYAWGMAFAGLAALDAEDGGTDSAPIRPCREAGTDRAVHVVDYHVGLVPLDFECRLDDGGSYTTSAVPGYVNPATAALGLAGAFCGITAGAVTELRARSESTLATGKDGP